MRTRKSGTAALLTTIALFCGYPTNSPTETERNATQKEDCILATADELGRIGIASTIDRIERGGVGIWQNGKLTIREIENDVRRDEERFWNYVEGNLTHQSTLTNHCHAMAYAQGVNMPELKMEFLENFIEIRDGILTLHTYPLEVRQEKARELWRRYDSDVRHNMYLIDPQADIDQRNVAFYFHTHPEETGQENQLRGPSPQDLDVSCHRPELVITARPDGRYWIHYARNGTAQLIISHTPLYARR